MKDEIKEILDDLRKTADNTIFAVCSSQEELDKMPKYTANFLSINDRKAKLLLDYITNLQEENKRLKQKCDFYHNEFIEEKIKNCKAREYIKDCGYNRWCYGEAEEDLLEILQGKSDE